MCPAGRSAWLEQWNWKSPATCLTVCSSTKEKQKKQTVSSTKWHKRKENPSPARLDVAVPQNRHLKMRLIQPLPLRAARRKNSRKTIMHRCNQGRFKEKEKTKLNKKKKAIYSTHFLFARTGKTTRDVSDLFSCRHFCWVDLKFDFYYFYFKRDVS